MRRRGLRLATERAQGRLAPFGRTLAGRPFSLSDFVGALHRLLRSLGHRVGGLGLERDAGAPCLGEADGDRLLRRGRTVFALPDVVHLLPDELPRGSRGTLALTKILFSP